MNRFVLYNTVLVLSALVIFTSCGKEEEFEEDYNAVKLLKTITYVSDDKQYKYDQYKFEYDEQNRIIKISELFYDGNISYTQTFTYEKDDLVQVLFSYSCGSIETYEYTKSGNIITQKYSWNSDGISEGYIIPNFTTIYTIELNSDGLPIKQELEEEESDNTNVEIFEYQDGNLTKSKQIYTSMVYDFTDTYTYTYFYDDKKGALYDCKTPKWYLIMYLNNLGVENNITEGGHRFRPWTVYNYKYDKAGFPAGRTRNFLGQMTESKSDEVFTYIKK